MTFSFENAGRAPHLHRKSFITRMAVFWSLLTAGCTALIAVALINIISGHTGYIVMFSVFGLVGVLTGYWMFAYLRDMKAELTMVEGEISRKWVRGQILEFFLQACYISVEGKIFVIRRLDYASLLETDLVRVHCYPHSLTVVSIERYDEIDKRYVPADGGDAS